MNKRFFEQLLEIVKKRMGEDDPAHDISHILRALNHAKKILVREKANADVVLPAVMMHDLVTYPKNDPRNENSVKESAVEAEKILFQLNEYNKEDITKVKKCILCTSFTYGLPPRTLEEKITVDADLLEATGAISIMRTFSSGGKMGRPLYNLNDPFAKKRQPEDLLYSLDLFFTRLLKVEEKLNTETAKRMARQRKVFLLKFLDQLKSEIC